MPMRERSAPAGVLHSIVRGAICPTSRRRRRRESETDPGSDVPYRSSLRLSVAVFSLERPNFRRARLQRRLSAACTATYRRRHARVHAHVFLEQQETTPGPAGRYRRTHAFLLPVGRRAHLSFSELRKAYGYTSYIFIETAVVRPWLSTFAARPEQKSRAITKHSGTKR